MNKQTKQFIITISIILITRNEVRSQAVTTASCKEALGEAIPSQHYYFTSPNFPKQFPAQTQCNWVIRAKRKYRVELSFSSFYLVGKLHNKACARQHVKILDTFSRVTDGPYCGNTPPPPLVSTGSTIRITLESNAVGVAAQQYRGFQAVYRATRKPSSERLRDSGGKWRYFQVLGGDNTATTTTTTTVVTRNVNEVDKNNNAALDAINHQLNNQNNQHNAEINQKNNQVEIEPLPANKFLLPSRGPNRRRKKTTTPPSYSRKYLTSPRNRPPNHQRKGSDSSSGQTTTSTGVIVAIVVITLLAVMLAIILFKIRKRRKKKRHSSEEDGQSSMVSTDLNSHVNSPKEEIRPPPTVQRNERLPGIVQVTSDCDNNRHKNRSKRGHNTSNHRSVRHHSRKRRDRHHHSRHHHHRHRSKHRT